MTVEEFLEAKRCRLTLNETIARWLKKYQQHERSEIAPDGFPYNLGARVPRGAKAN